MTEGAKKWLCIVFRLTTLSRITDSRRVQSVVTMHFEAWFSASSVSRDNALWGMILGEFSQSWTMHFEAWFSASSVSRGQCTLRHDSRRVQSVVDNALWGMILGEFSQSWTMHFEASYTTSDKFLLAARHILTTGLQKCLDVNFAVSLSQPSIVKRLRNGSKSGQGT